MDETEALQLMADIAAQITARARMPVDVVAVLGIQAEFIEKSVCTQLGIVPDDYRIFTVNTADVYAKYGCADWRDPDPDIVAVLIKSHALSSQRKMTVTIRVMQIESAMPKVPLDVVLAGSQMRRPTIRVATHLVAFPSRPASRDNQSGVKQLNADSQPQTE
jgi:hypothetical protein